MPTFTNIYSRIWNDKKFRSLSLPAQILFFNLVCNSDITLCGIYELILDDIKSKYEIKLLEEYRYLFRHILKIEITEELRNNIIEYTKVRFKMAFEEVINENLIEYDYEKELVFIKSRFKYLPNHYSIQVIRGVIKELNLIRHPFRDNFIKIYDDEFQYYKIFLNGLEISEKELENPQQLKTIKYVLGSKERVSAFLTHKNCKPAIIKEVIEGMF